MHSTIHDILARTIPAAVVAVAFLVTAVAASAAEPGETIVLDQPSGFGDPLRGAGNYSASIAGAVSADGRYVVFGVRPHTSNRRKHDRSTHHRAGRALARGAQAHSPRHLGGR